MKSALILGCSHAAGSEMHLEPGIDLGGYNHQTFGIYNSYPAMIAQLLGYHPMNHAIPGGSNDAMFRICERFFNPYTTKTKPSLIIACWTGANRTEIMDEQHETWQALAPGKQTFYKIKTDGSVPEGEFLPESVDNENELLAYQKQWVIFHSHRWGNRLNKIKNILALNAMAESEAVPVININSFDSINEFKWPKNVWWPLPGKDEFSLWASRQGYSKTEQGHFFSQAHQNYAKLVIQQLPESFRA